VPDESGLLSAKRAAALFALGGLSLADVPVLILKDEIVHVGRLFLSHMNQPPLSQLIYSMQLAGKKRAKGGGKEKILFPGKRLDNSSGIWYSNPCQYPPVWWNGRHRRLKISR
jgi:hypothetical protein